MPLYLGLMSGTSMDSVDAVLARIVPGKVSLLARREEPIPQPLRSALIAALRTAELSALEFWHLDSRLGELFARAALALLAENRIEASDVAAIGCHGQTLYHAPESEPPLTVQAGDPNIIAARTGIATVADFRRRDVALGGQGAPLAPGFHDAVFRSRGERRAVVNIGGIANVTVLGDKPGESIVGYDSGPGNTLLDLWCEQHTGRRFDVDGRWAMSGKVCEPLLELMMQDPYFARSPPKSTGREHFNLDWLAGVLARLSASVSERDVQRTLVELTARSIAATLSSDARRPDGVYLCGGGALNPLLRRALHGALGNVRLETTAVLGVHPKDVEPLAFAWLAHRTLSGQSGNVPEVTGARQRSVLGAIYPRSDEPGSGATAPASDAE